VGQTLPVAPARSLVARLVGGTSLAGLVAGLLTAGSSLVAAPPAAAALGPAPGTVAHPISRVHLENFEWFNILQVVDTQNRIIRTIKIAGNPLIPKPDVCYTGGRLRVNWDYTLTWQLNYFTRLCAARGMGSHDIPINRYSGRRSMNAADLGKAPFHGGPLSHGCLRMAAVDAKYIYDNLSNGVPIYFVKTPWRVGGPRPPSAATPVRVVPGDHQLAVTWASPVLHGATVSGFVVSLSPGAARLTVSAAARSATFTGLVNGTSYSASVVATSSAGPSIPAASAAVVPYGLPGAAATVVAVRGEPGRVYVTWAPAGANGAPVSSYLVSVNGLTALRVAPYPTQTVVGSVPPGTTLHVEVVAVNAAGAGPPGVYDHP
jgi:hypothetical protein